jgi:hypothetical protein
MKTSHLCFLNGITFLHIYACSFLIRGGVLFESMDSFPEDFTTSGVISLREKQVQESHDAQPVLMTHIRALIHAASMASIARQNTLVRFGFRALVDLLKKERAISIYIHLEHASAVTLVGELLTRFPKGIRALDVTMGADGIPREGWVSISKGEDYPENRDLEISFVE